MTHLTTVTVPDIEAAVEHLAAAGTKGPSLHPDVNNEDHRERWNGWNYTRASGVDADGAPVMLESWHFARGGWVQFSGLGRLGDPEFAWEGLRFPLELLPARPDIQHPEHTPS